jgi:hypothetical protein
MKNIVLSSMLALAAFSSDAQYRREAQLSQDTLVGKKVWKAPPFPMEGNSIVYTETIVGTGLSREILFKNALEWYNYNYKSADTRLTVEKPAEGKISGTGLIKYNPAAAGVAGEVPIIFNFDILVADGQYTYRFYDMYGVDESGRFDYIDMYREDRNISTQVRQRWNKRYRYEMLSDMNTMVEMAIVHLKQVMAMNSGLVTK